MFINVNCDYMCLLEKLNHALFSSYDESHKSNVADLSDSRLRRSRTIPSVAIKTHKTLIKPISTPESTIVNRDKLYKQIINSLRESQKSHNHKNFFHTIIQLLNCLFFINIPTVSIYLILQHL